MPDVFSMSLRELEKQEWSLEVSKDFNLLIWFPALSKQCIELHLDEHDKEVIHKLSALLKGREHG